MPQEPLGSRPSIAPSGSRASSQNFRLCRVFLRIVGKISIALKEELSRIRGPLHITAEYSVTPLWQFVFLVLAVATVAIFAGTTLAIQQLAAAVSRAARVEALNRTVRLTGQLTELPLVPSLFAHRVELLPTEIIRVGDFQTVNDLVNSKLPEKSFRRHTKISVMSGKISIALKEELSRIRGSLHITAENSVTPLWQFAFLVLAVATVAFATTLCYLWPPWPLRRPSLRE
ncbi:Hypothetical Protein FCC1311_015212 [Hondaea fermentalgiana]|uniref:Uncharacterized protein n=1 Tax=Hondaea fermentalgiana TaxID=2315210 RepID=A0A2R5GC31_9STRA|nr:Hypothetical Protein FCC1311_015212 [Hondaea fermentalgiana]|eukprot:GBG25304.1 Hypothetical Protein FCC1311_015212 [Hondaea fermentalgiana]